MATPESATAPNEHAVSPEAVSRARTLVARMTTEEKATLLSGNGWWSTHQIDRLGIAAMTMNDGPHGIRKSAPGAIHSTVAATCFPTASALASSWNESLVRQVGEAIGKEAQACNVHLLLGPGVNMKRSPLAGRNFEYYSEDPILTGKLAAAYIKGVQSQGVGTCLKHFAVNNQEFERMVNSSELDQRTLHEIYLPAFEVAVKEAQPWSVMCAYNKINGIYAAENEELLTNILRRDWGFRGCVISDWGAVTDRLKSLEAGLNLEMPGSGRFNRDKIVDAVNKGALCHETLDRAVRELLAVMLHSQSQFEPLTGFDANNHHDLARAAAGESIVLLKNENQILPLGDSTRKVAIIGRFAREPRFQGAGSSQVRPTRISAAYDELVAMAGREFQFSYAPGYDEAGGTNDSLLNEARTAAQGADIAIVFAGLPDSYESEGFDRESLDLPKGHEALIRAVAQAQSNCVVVLVNGAAVTMPWINEVHGLLEAWLGGQAGGAAIADVLLGKTNPSGKLSETFPQQLEDTPPGTDFPGRNKVTYYGEQLLVGYRHYDARRIEPLFPFGFGLSYTTFSLSTINASIDTFAAAEGVEVEVTVRNTGARAGKEVVQLYVSELEPGVSRPPRELKVFAKVSLAAGEQTKVTFTLRARDFAFYDPQRHEWIVKPGDFEILVGNSSRHLPLKKVVHVQSTIRALPLNRESMLKEFRDHPVGKKFYPELLNVMGVNTDEPDPAELATLPPSERAERKKAHAMMMAFLYDFPVGKIPAWSEGRLTEERLAEILVQVSG